MSENRDLQEQIEKEYGILSANASSAIRDEPLNQDNRICYKRDRAVY